MTENPIVLAKELNIIKVLALISNGVSKAQACKKQNISVSTFDRYLADHPDVASEYFAEAKVELGAMFTDIIKARKKAIRYMAQNDPESLREAIALDRRLSTLQTELVAMLNPNDEDDDSTPASMRDEEAEKFLSVVRTGPQLKRATSKTTISTITKEETVEFGDSADDETVDADMVIDIPEGS